MAISRKVALILPHQRTLYGIIENGETITGEMGGKARQVVDLLEDFVCYSPDLKSVMALCDARYFTSRQRRERTLDIRIDEGNKVAALPSFDLSPEEYALAFFTYVEWVRSIGVEFDKRAGWNTVGRRIWKLTDGETKFKGPEIGRLAFYGGRKQAPYPTTYKRARHYDITGAYLDALGSFPIPRRLKESGPTEWRIPELDGIAFAQVTIPEHYGDWAPLPVRANPRMVRMLRFPTGEFEGWWSFSELRMASDYGAEVLVWESWAGQYSGMYFPKWQSTMLEGRSLPNGASKFAKQHANLLWSSFATSPSRILYKRYNDQFAREPKIIKETQPGFDFTARTAFIASIVSSRIRERLYREILCPNGTPNLYIVHCDTDGFITGSASNPLDRLNSTIPDRGTDLGRWRLTKELPLVQIKSPNAYRYICYDCGFQHSRWHYTCAGASNPDSARRIFRNTPTTSSPLELDTVNAEELPELLADYKPKRKRR